MKTDQPDFASQAVAFVFGAVICWTVATFIFG